MKDLKWLVRFLEEHKMKNISVYDLTEDKPHFVVVASALSIQTNKQVCDLLLDEYGALKIDGYSKGEWIVADAEDVTIHLFLSKIREKYNLDKLYKPKKIIVKVDKSKKSGEDA